MLSLIASVTAAAAAWISADRHEYMSASLWLCAAFACLVKLYLWEM